MRRLLLASLAGLAACGNFRETFTARGGVAAEAGSLKLTSERLAKILTGPRGLRPSKDAAAYVANLWVDYALFAQAAASGKLPADSASAVKALWPELAEIRTNHWHDSLMARRPQPSNASVDSLYNGDQVRVFQHILFQAPANAKPELKAAARKKAEATLAQLKRGADFDQLASELSDDPGSKRDAGYLPPSPRGSFVGSFDSAGWALAPGQMTGVVESPFGYHIIKRPAADAVHQRLVAFLGRSGGQHADSAYMEGLASASGLTVQKEAPAEMKAALARAEAPLRSTDKLATYKGGSFTVGDFMRWVRALPPPYYAQLRTANDTMLSAFARVLTLNTLLLRQADSANVQPTPDEWKQLYARYTALTDSLKADMGLASDSGTKAGATDAGAKVERYFDRLIAGQVRLRPIPSAMASVLRDRGRYRVNESGVTRAFELAQAQVAKNDSATAKAGPRGPVQRAPGPPPVPNAAPAPARPAPAPADTGKQGK
ncbi:MAG TPA: peptidylprolyl isomerase [Gemmatimonadales bacterium]|nr:peptidylprolyl isomerase [Gemmatimonadales bacterium]